MGQQMNSELAEAIKARDEVERELIELTRKRCETDRQYGEAMDGEESS